VVCLVGFDPRTTKIKYKIKYFPYLNKEDFEHWAVLRRGSESPLHKVRRPAYWEKMEVGKHPYWLEPSICLIWILSDPLPGCDWLKPRCEDWLLVKKYTVNLGFPFLYVLSCNLLCSMKNPQFKFNLMYHTYFLIFL
jgi:hypothetical protein